MIIPVIHCFDRNYVPPAAVAFLSMLEHADKAHEYRLYVLHSDIPEDDQRALGEIVSRFPNAKLEFIDMRGRFDSEFARVRVKGHYSAAVLYKLSVPSLFPQYDKAIVTDVDVMYAGDVAEEFVRFDIDGHDAENYLAGVGNGPNPLSCLRRMREAYTDFTEDERRRLADGVGGGYLFYNLRKMREDKLEDAFVSYLEQNVGRIPQLEQDVLNLCCVPRIKKLRLGVMACNYYWDQTTPEEREMLKGELEHPVQIHFVAADKPWNCSTCLFTEEWFAYLLKTPFLRRVLHGGFDYTGKWNYKFMGLPLVRRKVTTRRVTARLFGIIPLKEVRIQ